MRGRCEGVEACLPAVLISPSPLAGADQGGDSQAPGGEVHVVQLRHWYSWVILLGPPLGHWSGLARPPVLGRCWWGRVRLAQSKQKVRTRLQRDG